MVKEMISIIIPTLNRAGLLKLALESFCQQNFPVDQYEILVVDNGSTDNTKAVAEETFSAYPSHQTRYLYEQEVGSTSARHRGALEAKGDIFTFTDDDIEADPNWLQAIKRSFDDPTVQLVGGRNLPKYEVEPPKWLDWFWLYYPYGKLCFQLSLLDFGDQAKEIDPNDVWGENLSIRKNAFFELGGFHPDLYPSYLQHLQGDGDTGLTREAKRRGFKAIYHPEATVYHHVLKERMTYAYFEKRLFFHGISNSFAEIRAGGMNSIHQLRARLRFLTKIKARLQFLKRITHGYSAEQVALYQRFRRAEQQGYQFLQDAVRQHPDLLDWICKPDYWDCHETVQRLKQL
jgi:glucosyl-dolichyl phosphate glucuronosyltransferase